MRVICYNSGLGPLIPQGIKTTTIRALRKDGPREWSGDVLSHREWIGKPYRSKQRELCQTICKSVRNIDILQDGGLFIDDLPAEERKAEVAKADGFQNWEALFEYFNPHGPAMFVGEIIEWSAPKP